MAAAVEARKQGVSFVLIEAAEPFSTLVNFPRAKPIYTYPREMTPAGDLQVTAEVKEALVEELEAQVREHGIETHKGYVERVERAGSEHVVRIADQEPVRAAQRAGRDRP